MQVFFPVVTILLYLLSLLPFRVLYLVSDLLYLFFYYWPAYRKDTVRENLRIAFPEKGMHELQQIEQRFYRHFSDLIVEFIKMPSISKPSILSRVTFTNIGLLDDLAARSKGIIAVTSHMNNWEWGGMALSAKAVNFTCIGVYKPLVNKKFDHYFRQVRRRFGMELVPMKSTLRALIKHQQQRTITTLISDQTPTLGETELVIPFMGVSVPVFNGAAKLARITGYPVIYFSMKKTGRGRYSVEIVPLDNSRDGEYGITLKHVSLLENEIRNTPELWLWTHRRWKHMGKSFPPHVVYQ